MGRGQGIPQGTERQCLKEGYGTGGDSKYGNKVLSWEKAGGVFRKSILVSSYYFFALFIFHCFSWKSGPDNVSYHFPVTEG